MNHRVATWVAWAVPVIATAAMVAVGIITVSLPSGSSRVDEGLWLGTIAVVFGCVGALIISRHPENAMGRLFSGVGLAGVVAGSSAVYSGLGLPGSIWGVWLSTWSGGLIFAAVPLVLLLFPDGKPLSPGWRPVVWIAGMTAVILTLSDAFAPGRLEDSTQVNPAGMESLPVLAQPWLGWSVWGLLAAGVVAGAVSLIVRFRRSTGVQRQQLKWLALAAVFAGIGFVLLVATGGEQLLAAMVAAMTILLLPIAVGIAILRYRLYDIDVIINRALVYGGATAAMAGIYAVGVVGLGGLLQSTFSSDNDSLVVAASTLAVAALFRPVLRRLQSFIDRRFYRRKYDATRTIEAFSTRLRDEVDLESLTNDLVGVVHDTVQPAHIYLWLRP
jgi:MFS family permease